MSTRRSLKLPITLGVVMIVLVVALGVGWVLLTVSGALAHRPSPAVAWVLLAVGATLFGLVLAGVVLYLALSVKAINLTRRQSNFIDSVTHELKSPIASLKLYAQTLNRRQVSVGEQATFYRFMLEDIERLDHLINHVLEAGHLDKPTAEAEREDVELDMLLQSCAETIRSWYRLSPEVITLDMRPCLVHASWTDLEMVFRNLIDNAAKYAGDDPKVEIDLEISADGWAVVRIADNGRGIPQDSRRKIFGRFVRLGLELERDKPGTGLGLYIVRTLVKRMRGRIRVSGRENDTGTIFEVRLPGARITSDSGEPLPPGKSQDSDAQGEFPADGTAEDGKPGASTAKLP